MSACTMCRAGWHQLCDDVIEGTCCCLGRFSLVRANDQYDIEEAEHAGLVSGTRTAMETLTAATMDEGGAPRVRGSGSAAVDQGGRVEPLPEVDTPPPGRSGYIHPEAWGSPAVLGTLTDPKSTGRKRAAKLYPIRGGRVCDWARRVVTYGPVRIVGCLNNPATDLHHGPDKNTLNNAKASAGIGDTENVWLLCSECHNAVHGAMDPLYGPYDRTVQQAEPWLPLEDHGVFQLEEASLEELLEQERRREEHRRERGREHRGRNATGNTSDTGQG